jgi:hypothetical protein
MQRRKEDFKKAKIVLLDDPLGKEKNKKKIK